MSIFLGFLILRKCSRNLVLRDLPVCPTYCIPQLISVQSKKEDKDQEFIQSSTTPDPGYNINQMR